MFLKRNIFSEFIMKTQFRKNSVGRISLFVLLSLCMISIVGPYCVQNAPDSIVGSFSETPNSKHLLGTDQVGRDVLSRLISGTRNSLTVAMLVTIISVIVGVTLGLLSGYLGGKVDIFIMSITDVIMSFPYLLLVIVAAAIIGPGFLTTIGILSVVNIPGMIRIVRGNVLALRETDYIQAARMIGYSKRRVMFSELFPNTIASILIYSTSVFAFSILDETALSFFNLGIQTPTSSLGNMLNGAESLSILTDKPWLWLPPGIVIVLLVLSINFFGESLREQLDPENNL